MAKMPEEGRFEYGKMDKQTGAQWVHVTPEMARAHPQGKLNAALWAIAAVFAAFGAIRLYIIVLGYGDWLVWIGAGLSFLTALALAIRAPIALFLAGAQLLIGLFGLVTGGALKGLADVDGSQALNTLGLLIFSALALFYLMEGDRPNLIYRHRYRSFRGQQD